MTDNISIQRTLELLSLGQINDGQGRLRWSSNYTFLVSVCDDDYQVNAVYKPQRGERPLWDFPDGTLCYRETAAFVVSNAIGWHLVPPTVLRDGPHGVGSVQLYVEHNPEITYFNLGDSFEPQLQRFAIFDYITNNADRKGGHCLMDPHGKIWGIDHGICFHVAPKLRTVIWDFAGETLPSSLCGDVETFHQLLNDNESDVVQVLSKLLAEPELEALRTRTRYLLKRSKFPTPGHGPNYPWPPV